MTYFFTTFRNVEEESVACKECTLGPRKISHRASKGANADGMGDRRHLVESLYSRLGSLNYGMTCCR
jgi:hypothetical protein